LTFLAQNDCNCNLIDRFESVIVVIIVIELKWCNWSNSGSRYGAYEPRSSKMKCAIMHSFFYWPDSGP